MKQAQVKSTTVAEYIAGFPRPAQNVLRKVRATIRKAIPEAEEVISYSIPAYRVGGRVAIYFAGWKEHYSLYPSTAPIVAAFKDELSNYEISKGTIRLPLDEPVPVKLIAKIAKFRAKEAAERAATTNAAGKGRTRGGRPLSARAPRSPRSRTPGRRLA